MANGISNLGSLAQSARQKQLKVARYILLFVGILTVLVNVAQFAMIESQVDDLINKEVQGLHQRGMVEDQATVAKVRAQSVRFSQIIAGVAVALGVVFVVFGLVVNRFPVPITITSLVLYVGAAAVFGLIAPATLLQGIIVKVIIVIALAKSIQAAIAYEREKAAAPTAAMPA
jgi:hypothetical protein